MNQRNTLISGAIAGALAVAIGAFGAHGLKNILLANQRIDTFELAVKYQFYHALAIILTGLLMQTFPDKPLRWSALLFVFGIIIFSGSLYILSLTGIKVLGAITPIGGVCFIAGWLLMLLAFVKSPKR